MMTELENHPWLAVILSEIDDPTLPVDDENPLWDYIDSSITIIGTINHSQIDFDKLQQNALQLLKQTKDMRVITHLLRTLQHAKKPQNILLAIYLFSAYIPKYWLVSAPQPQLKKKLFRQVIQRFLQANKNFDLEATAIEKKLAFEYLGIIKKFFEENNQTIDDDFLQLITAYERFSAQSSISSVDENTIDHETPSKVKTATVDGNEVKNQPQQAAHTAFQTITINHNTEVEWKRTLIKVAELLMERNPSAPIGARLRRHAIFSSLSEPINNNNVTELMSAHIDRVNEYKSNIKNITIEEWIKIENELTLMPFWLEGHYISAAVASNLGFDLVAEAILDEVQVLLNRIPKLYDLKYSDLTPFISADMKKWLKPKNQSSPNEPEKLEELVFDCFDKNGLEVAVKMLEEHCRSQDMRDNYYCQKINAQLLKHAGFKAVAKQQALSILMACENMTLSEWEPSFIEALTQITRINNSVK
ncbi:type VI secretion system protein TssA [Gilliamella apicola]|uniref:Type VI secretion system protein TssA n=1 Tax=Gilliamella apicola TaxID=1196095 RepID=A0A2V4ERR0_9GAMM|nr:type VI secretion system protein TssA [Gilliamella apicola]PXZ07188.1 type VI secretion system protein TssA [Gilliamella apicola]